jgi:hypothetical protein
LTRLFFAHQLTTTRRRRQSHHLQAPFRVERLEYRPWDLEAFLAGLRRNGPKAVAEFEAYRRHQQGRKEK